ncbi:Hcp family type VI secretion system effector [Planctellipticum variicoloris]|jgi:type VI secretion system secreted protein Hcp|uniref:Hcp family type VI secretion system effector n=1 Tax=Planctellipticum variicoloris TaxID=3064265 RepID=UPI002C44F8F5|nr:type VI secretion system tube protein Hcp [Planctomycetaceae bacterium SH412]HTN02301.1 type VI secretion system tube protein Hcp [Planctomycetaceae bacterium]
MAADILLKIEGITGESKIDGHEGEIDVLSVSWGASNASSAHFGGGAGTARGNCSDMSIMKRIDNASPEFFKKTMDGTHFDSATLVLRLAGGDAPVDYFKVEMTHVFITSWSPSGSGDQHGMESVSLSFEQVKVTYTGQNDDGSPKEPVEVGWDIVAHKSM